MKESEILSASPSFVAGSLALKELEGECGCMVVFVGIKRKREPQKK